LDGGTSDPLIDDYALSIQWPRPGNSYVKDVTYGGASVLHRPLRLGSSHAGAELRVTLEPNGGILKTRLVDEERQPVGNVTMILIPKEVATHMRLAETRIAQKTDQTGEYTSPGLPPGTYLVLATADDFTDLSPETISALFNARSKAKEASVGVNSTVELTLELTQLNR
jgi:hypothetical protein